MSSVICFNFDQSKILSSGNGLTHKAAFTTLVAFEASLVQDHAAQLALYLIRQF